MITIAQDDVSFKTFTDILTGYRLSALLRSAHASGLFSMIGTIGSGLQDICKNTGWEEHAAARFLKALCETGLLEKQEERYFLTAFSKTFLHPESKHYQGKTLTFEKRLIDSWECIADTLSAGCRVHDLGDKNSTELENAYREYLGAMDEAAGVRALEFWDCITPEAHGTILDIGAGSGRFLKDFLTQHTGWQGIFCDLPNVVTYAACDNTLAQLKDRLRYLPCNFLDSQQLNMGDIPEQSCSLVLLSNVVHCQGKKETSELLRQAAKKTAGSGLLLIHDFFTDTPVIGPLYDIHMMLNTFNGRTYSHNELIKETTPLGLHHTARIMLASGSELIAFAYSESHIRTLLKHERCLTCSA